MELPPKTCSIDRLITRPEDIRKALEGKKRSQRRNGRYADPGERWTMEGGSFEITRVYTQTLGDIDAAQALEEGYESLEAYRESILAMHPGMPWIPKAPVWVHEFRRLTDT